MSDDKKVIVNSIGICPLVFIVFLVLKLCKVITWSWLWVTAPIWIPLGLNILVLIVYTIIMVCKRFKK